MSDSVESGQTRATTISERAVERHKLSDLWLDSNNPRFGGLGASPDQSKVVNFIVTQFGVEDVLASLATNGYFHSEPLVAKRENGKLVVVEGNRRLAALLILAGDARAMSVASLRPARVAHDWSSNSEVPVLVFDEADQSTLLPYLGVRHIVGSQPWDSYAKARWIDMVVSQNQMSLSEIETAIGDANRTITRMLDGYRFIQQLIESGGFKPAESHRRGKGSNVNYPFSWIYTLLDYSQVREYLELPPRSEAVARPIPARSIGAASRAVAYMFGDSERVPSITNSRQIPDLADALSDPIRREKLEQGYSIDRIVQESRPVADRLATLVRECHDSLTAANGIVVAGLPAKDAMMFVARVNELRNLSASLFRQIQGAAYPSDEDATH